MRKIKYETVEDREAILQKAQEKNWILIEEGNLLYENYLIFNTEAAEEKQQEVINLLGQELTNIKLQLIMGGE